jgi:hypothetical protein
MSYPQLTRSLFLQPEEAFAALRREPRFGFPLLLLGGVTLAALGLYFGRVDFSWLQEQLLASVATSSQGSVPQLSARTLMVTSLLGTVITIVCARLLESGYYFLAGRVTRLEYPFRQWLALACWASLPLLALPLVSMGVLALHPSGQVLQEQLNALSLNELLFRAPPESPWYALLNSLSVLHPWTWWLSVIGVRTWSGRGWGFCVVFALLPWVLMYGIWALVVGL